MNLAHITAWAGIDSNLAGGHWALSTDRIHLFFESEIILRPSFNFETSTVVCPIYGPYEALNYFISYIFYKIWTNIQIKQLLPGEGFQIQEIFF